MRLKKMTLRKTAVLALPVAALTLLALLVWPVDAERARWDGYLDRLARLSRQTVPPAAPLDLRPYPGNAALRRSPPDLRAGLLDYLDLRHCNLMALISDRNSGLGRVRAASLRLAYELTFIHRGRRCLAEGALRDAETVALLERTLAIKEDSLKDVFWNATWASDELRGFFNQSPGAADEIDTGLHALDGLIGAGRALAARPPPATLPALETHLAALAASRAGGRLLRDLARARVALGRANALLDGLDGERLCPRGRASPRARRLRTLLDGYYRTEIQAHLAALDRQRRRLEDTLAGLVRVTGDDPALAAWRAHYLGPAGQAAGLARALRRHTERWQDLMGACGLMPGAAKTGTDTY